MEVAIERETVERAIAVINDHASCSCWERCGGAWPNCVGTYCAMDETFTVLRELGDAVHNG